MMAGVLAPSLTKELDKQILSIQKSLKEKSGIEFPTSMILKAMLKSVNHKAILKNIKQHVNDVLK